MEDAFARTLNGIQHYHVVIEAIAEAFTIRVYVPWISEDAISERRHVDARKQEELTTSLFEIHSLGTRDLHPECHLGTNLTPFNLSCYDLRIVHYDQSALRIARENVDLSPLMV